MNEEEKKAIMNSILYIPNGKFQPFAVEPYDQGRFLPTLKLDVISTDRNSIRWTRNVGHNLLIAKPILISNQIEINDIDEA